MAEGRSRRRSRVPAGRLERLARIGWTAGELALGGVADSVRRAIGAEGEAGNLFLTGANAKRLARRLSSMRGAAMKLGQLLPLADSRAMSYLMHWRARHVFTPPLAWKIVPKSRKSLPKFRKILPKSR